MQNFAASNLEQIFQICNTIALAAWLLLVFLPGWSWTQKLVVSGGFSIFLAAIYLIFVITFFGTASGDFFTLDGINALFSHKPTLLAAWIHYLVFDLFVGSWEVADSRRIKMPHLLVVPCLILTFMLGPIGFLLYHAVSWRWRAAAQTVI